MSEWFKVQPWKGCVREIAPRVRIPLSAPIEESCKENFLFLFKFARIRTGGIAKATVFAFARPGVIAEYPAKHNLPRSESLFMRQSNKENFLFLFKFARIRMVEKQTPDNKNYLVFKVIFYIQLTKIFYLLFRLHSIRRFRHIAQQTVLR